MAEFSTFEVSTWIRKLGPRFKEAIIPYGLSCIFPCYQIKVDEALLRAITNYWIPSQHVFQFNGVEICPNLEEFSAIVGEPSVNDLVFPTTGGDLPTLIQVLLGDPLEKAKQWCVFGKLNVHLIFAYFSWLAIPTTEMSQSRFLNAFYLCMLARYFLVIETYCVDHRMCLVVANLRNINLASMILAKALNGLDAFHKKEANFFTGSPLLL